MIRVLLKILVRYGYLPIIYISSLSQLAAMFLHSLGYMLLGVVLRMQEVLEH